MDLCVPPPSRLDRWPLYRYIFLLRLWAPRRYVSPPSWPKLSYSTGLFRSSEMLTTCLHARRTVTVSVSSIINIPSSTILFSATIFLCKSKNRLNSGLLKPAIRATLVVSEGSQGKDLKCYENFEPFRTSHLFRLVDTLCSGRFMLFQVSRCCKFKGKPNKFYPRHPIEHLLRGNSILFYIPPPEVERTHPWINPYFGHRVLENRPLTDSVIWSINPIIIDRELNLVFLCRDSLSNLSTVFHFDTIDFSGRQHERSSKRTEEEFKSIPQVSHKIRHTTHFQSQPDKDDLH